MESLIYILFICVSLPVLICISLMDKDSRRILIFLLIGAAMCMYVSSVNGLVMNRLNVSFYTICTTFTPITEEIMKAIPIFLFGFFVSDDRATLMSISVAEGVGFAILENVYIFAQNNNSLNLFWAVSRVFGATLMHAICTLLVGLGISFVRKKKKLFYTGSFALLLTAMVYHGIFNVLVQSDYSVIGFFLPIVSYIPLLITYLRQKKTGYADLQ